MAKSKFAESVSGKDSKAKPDVKSAMSTISVAVCASCIENAQSLELATLLAGQIARACVVFNVDEIIVLDDCSASKDRISQSAAIFARLLQFMETPQYLRKALIPMHSDLRYVGILPPLDTPHHLRATEWCNYREGVVKEDASSTGSFINVGLTKDAWVNSKLRAGARVTLQLGNEPQVSMVDGIEVYQANLSLPSEEKHIAEPRRLDGLYWGYSVRIATTFSALLRNGPFNGGYDLTIGTSEHGEARHPCELQFPQYEHALIVLGGPQGLEYCLENDPWREEYESPKGIFQWYLNTCQKQGSRTIRTEEALLISLSFFQPALAALDAQP